MKFETPSHVHDQPSMSVVAWKRVARFTPISGHAPYAAPHRRSQNAHGALTTYAHSCYIYITLPPTYSQLFPTRRLRVSAGLGVSFHRPFASSRSSHAVSPLFGSLYQSSYPPRSFSFAQMASQLIAQWLVTLQTFVPDQVKRGVLNASNGRVHERGLAASVRGVNPTCLTRNPNQRAS